MPEEIKEVPTIAEQNKAQRKKNLRYARDKDREIVKGIFRFHEVPGGFMEFVIKLYKEDVVEKYSFYDGQIYTIPLGVAKHLNKNGWYPVHKHAVDSRGVTSQEIGQKVRRFSFQSLDFIDIADLTPVGAPEIEIVS